MKQRKIKAYLKNRPDVFETSFEETKKHDTVAFEGKIVIPDWLEDKQTKKTRRTAFKLVYTACGIILAFSLFIVITPPGRALAQSVYQMFVSWFDDGVIIQYGEIANIDIHNDIVEYTDLEIARQQEQLPLAGSGSYELVMLTINKSDVNTSIHSKYKLNHGATVNIYQIILNQNSGSTSQLQSTGKPIDITFDGDKRAVGFVDDINAIASSYFDNIGLDFYSDTADYDEFVKFISTVTVN